MPVLSLALESACRWAFCSAFTQIGAGPNGAGSWVISFFGRLRLVSSIRVSLMVLGCIPSGEVGLMVQNLRYAAPTTTPTTTPPCPTLLTTYPAVPVLVCVLARAFIS